MFISNVHMSSSAEPRSGSSVARRELSAMVDSERSRCSATGISFVQWKREAATSCMWRLGRVEAPEPGTKLLPVVHLQQREGALSLPGNAGSMTAIRSRADRRRVMGECLEKHSELMVWKISFIPFEKTSRGCDFFHMGKAVSRKPRIPSDFNSCVSWFLCLRAGYRGGNDTVAQCLRLATYCLEHVERRSVKEQSEENKRVQTIV